MQSEYISTETSCLILKKPEIRWKRHVQIYAKKVCHNQQSLPAWRPQIQSCQELFIIAADSFTQNMSVNAAAVPFCRHVGKRGTHQKISFLYERHYAESITKLCIEIIGAKE